METVDSFCTESWLNKNEKKIFQMCDPFIIEWKSIEKQSYFSAFRFKCRILFSYRKKNLKPFLKKTLFNDYYISQKERNGYYRKKLNIQKYYYKGREEKKERTCNIFYVVWYFPEIYFMRNSFIAERIK